MLPELARLAFLFIYNDHSVLTEYMKIFATLLAPEDNWVAAFSSMALLKDQILGKSFPP